MTKSKARNTLCSARIQPTAAAVAGLLFSEIARAQTATVSVAPDADAFVWSLEPTNNYGGGGALSVSGSAAVNSTGQQEGLFDTLMRFPMTNVVAALDASLGTGDWIVTGCRLTVNEMASPDSSIFNAGVGAFQVFWLASDTWIEGTGKPIAPTTDGVTWNDLPGIVNSNLDASLGIFTNAGLNAPISFTLSLASPLIQAIQHGTDVALHLTAASPSIGFTFNSRNFGNTNDQPQLQVTAAVNPQPRIAGIALTGAWVSVSFATLSNWTYRLQTSGALVPAGGSWTDLVVVPAQPVSSNVVYLDAVTNSGRLYRLSVSP